MVEKIKSCFKIDNKYLGVLLFSIILILQTILFIAFSKFVIYEVNTLKPYYDLPVQYDANGSPYYGGVYLPAHYGLLIQNYISYKYGFVSRGLLNTIIYLLYLPVSWILGFFNIRLSLFLFTVICKYIFLIPLDVILASVMVKILKVLYDRLGNKAYYVYLVYICMFNVYIVGFEYRYTDYILFMLQIASVYFVLKRKELLALVPMIASLCIHEGSLLLTCPVVFIIAVTMHLHDDAKSKAKSYAKLFAIGIVLLTLGMYFLKFQGYFHDESSVVQVYKDILSDMGAPVNADWVNRVSNSCRLAWQLMLSEGTTKWNNVSSAEYNGGEYNYAAMFVSLVSTVIYVLTLLPILITALKYLIPNIKNTKSVFIRFEKILIMSAGVLAVLPFIIFKEDIARWITFIWLYYLILMIYEMYQNSDIPFNIFYKVKDKALSLLKVSKTNIVPILLYFSAILPFGGGVINLWYILITYEIVGPFMVNYCPGFLGKAVDVRRMLNGG